MISFGAGRLINNQLTITLNNRLLSIDVFRGMTIAFMIIVNTPGSWSYVYSPLLHAQWHGCTFTDLVFPFFLFVIGLSMAFSQEKMNAMTTSDKMQKLIKRSLLIFLVGFLLNWFPFFNRHISDVRFLGVLQRIGLSYFVAGFILILLKNDSKKVVGIIATLLLGYWGVMYFGGDYSLEGNVNNKLDSLIFPEKNLYGGFGIKFDPEGLLGIFSSGAHVLIGYLIGSQLFKYKSVPINFLKPSIIIGVSLTLVGLLWNSIYPINKPLWTSSYVLYTCGIATVLLSLLVYIIDVIKFHKWTFPFKVFGLNPLFSFVLSVVLVKIMLYVITIDGKSSYAILYADLYRPYIGDHLGSLAFAVSICLLVFVFAFLLYRKKIIIKL